MEESQPFTAGRKSRIPFPAARPGPAASPSACPAASRSPPTATRVRSCAAAAAPTRSPACGCSTSATRQERLVVDPRAARRPATRGPAARGAGPARARPASRRAASSPTPPTAPATVAAFALVGRPVRGRPARRRAAASCDAAGAGRRPAPRPAPAGGSRTSPAARCTSLDLATGNDRTLRPSPRRRRSPTGWRSSSPPRRWTGCAATGGRPDGDALLVARVDDAPVPALAHRRPGQPGPRARRPSPTRRRARRTPQVALLVLGAGRRPGSTVAGTRARTRTWPRRVGRRTRLLDRRAVRATSGRCACSRVDPATGATRARARGHRPGLGGHRARRARPHLADGALVCGRRRRRPRALLVDGEPVTPPTLQVRAVLDVDGDTRAVQRRRDEPTEIAAVDLGRPPRLAGAHPGARRARAAAGRRRRRGGRGSASTSTALDHGACAASGGRRPTIAVATPSAPGLRPAGHAAAGPASARCATAVLLPRGTTRRPPLPGPDGPVRRPARPARARRPRRATWSRQWFADQGFAVVVADGRGTPGRGPALERAVHGDLAAPVLEDQVDALQALAAGASRPGPERVGIRGWSFGGYLAALAVLRRPDVFHAAVAGAPVTDWRAVRHALHRALPGPPRHRRRRRTRERSLLADAAEAGAGRCCSSTGWPTTTWSSPTPCGCRRRCWPRAARTACCRCRASPT